ncbi:MAG TPA: cupin domain-containing protein, partial [Lachnospiraceae bacterium]|nr:cupin domain-containing protein [Lachnospiraceae bacterium]
NAFTSQPCPYCGRTLKPNDDNYNYPYRKEMGYEKEFDSMQLTTDYGPEPFVVNINEATKQNDMFRTALWTGNHLQLTLMSINVGEDIGIEVHPDLDQFIRVEEGQGMILMGNRKDRLNMKAIVSDDFAFIIPAGTFHNLINTGNIPLKVYSIYAPPQHPHGTVHETKADAQAAE